MVYEYWEDNPESNEGEDEEEFNRRVVLWKTVSRVMQYQMNVGSNSPQM